MTYYKESEALPRKARMYAFQDGFLYTAVGAVASYTQRHPGVLLISLDGRRFRIQTECQRVSGRAVLVAPQVKRLINAEGRKFAALHVEPSHSLYRSLLAGGAKRGLSKLSYDQFLPFVSELNECHQHNVALDNAEELFEAVLETLTDILGKPEARDDRIERVLDWLQAQSPLDYEFDVVTAQAGLSAGRLSHLFTGEVGLSLRSFLLWRKTKEALGLINTDMNLTDIAHASGFSDSAHFTRTFSNTLGVLPSMLRDDRCVQVVN